MKILGEKSLASKVKNGLKGLFVVIIILDLITLWIFLKITYGSIRDDGFIESLSIISIFIAFYITGLMAIFIIYQFIKIFQKLKENELFIKENTNRLDIITKTSILMGFLYFIVMLGILFNFANITESFIFILFLFIFSIIFFTAGIGIKILNEIYKKAIDYKEENELTI